MDAKRVSRVGNCYDNAVVERFLGTLKRECPMDFATRQPASRNMRGRRFIWGLTA